MHRVNRVGDSVFVDEVDLVNIQVISVLPWCLICVHRQAISNLCSAYSYCLSVLDALYVWHGRGSSEDERRVASAYAQSLKTESTNVEEFEEGAEDEMFWMVLGDDPFANADHWKFKNHSDITGARLFNVDSSRLKDPVGSYAFASQPLIYVTSQVQRIACFSGRDLNNRDVFVVDCRLELFVVVTPQARGKRVEIQLGLFLAEASEVI